MDAAFRIAISGGAGGGGTRLGGGVLREPGRPPGDGGGRPPGLPGLPALLQRLRRQMPGRHRPADGGLYIYANSRRHDEETAIDFGRLAAWLDRFGRRLLRTLAQARVRSTWTTTHQGTLPVRNRPSKASSMSAPRVPACAGRSRRPAEPPGQRGSDGEGGRHLKDTVGAQGVEEQPRQQGSDDGRRALRRGGEDRLP